MAPFQYTAPTPRFAAAIAEMIARASDPQAQAAERIAQAQAQATQQGAAAWGGAVQQIGQSVGAIPQQIQQQRQSQAREQAAAQEAKLRGQQIESGALQLADARRTQGGQQVVANMMQGDTLPAGATGPRQENYLDTNGLFDVKRITAALGQAGYGDKAADLVKGAESINDSILKHQDYEQKAAAAKTVLFGDLAAGALKLSATGMPLGDAMDFVAQPALATKRFTPEEYGKIRQQIGAVPPEQQQQALTALVNAAARVAPVKTIAKDTIEVDAYGRTIATNMVAPTPTRASLAADLSSPDEAVRARAKTAIDALRAPEKRTGDEQALDAFAKSLGKTKAEDLDYAERQVFDKNKAAIASATAQATHIADRNYDNAHPAPEKPKKQDDLEQEYRTVLTRGLSSRSGGLGLEDAKVQTANHLMALLDQSYDAKTGNYNIPKVMQTELALGLARLISPNGTVGVQLVDELNQATAKGDFGKMVTYVTGTPANGSTQDVVKMFRDSILRQGQVAQENRENEMRYLRGLAPTALEEKRRLALEENSLGALRQSRTATDAQGNRRLFVSTDGGKTWK